MIDIQAVTSPDEKSAICRAVLEALPAWFGNSAAINDYTNKVRALPFYAACDASQTVGFLAILEHNAHTAEVCVMGILPAYHRHGIGRRLIARCEAHCAAAGKAFLTVKTLDASADYAPYDATRTFYLSMGFLPLEVFPLHWDAENPCLFLAKAISENSDLSMKT